MIVLLSPNHFSLLHSFTLLYFSWVFDFKEPNATIVDHRFCITGFIETVSSPISSLCVSPFYDAYHSLVALGTYHGTLQVITVLHSDSTSI